MNPRERFQNTGASLVVRLDDQRYGAGPATVIAIVSDGMAGLEEFFAIARKSAGTMAIAGTRDPALRLWRGEGYQVGDRIRLDDSIGGAS